MIAVLLDVVVGHVSAHRDVRPQHRSLPQRQTGFTRETHNLTHMCSLAHQRTSREPIPPFLRGQYAWRFATQLDDVRLVCANPVGDRPRSGTPLAACSEPETSYRQPWTRRNETPGVA